LAGPGKSQHLSASLRWPEGKRVDDVVALTVDGWERAFVYKCPFAAGADSFEAQQDIEARVWPERVAPKPETPDVLTLRVKTENIQGWATARLTVELKDEETQRLAYETPPRIGAREQRVQLLQPAADGSLQFKTAVSDWTIPIPIAGLTGKFTARAILKQPDVERPVEGESAVIWLHAQPPENVRIILPEPESTVVRGTDVTVIARVDENGFRIKSVFFFLGKPKDDKTLPANARGELGKPVDAATWSAKLPISKTAKPPYPISVLFTNEAELTSFATVLIEPVDPNAPSASKTPASISGHVAEDKSPQPALRVELRDANRALAGTTKTDKDGAYKFENVKPGAYTVNSLKGSNYRRASVPVEVKEFEQKTGVDLLLKR
jgi:hypothetical protein